jgi:hypothetical protein
VTACIVPERGMAWQPTRWTLAQLAERRLAAARPPGGGHVRAFLRVTCVVPRTNPRKKELRK